MFGLVWRAHVGKTEPNSIDHSQMTRKATWCGIVFALAVLLTVLNCFPPFDIHYHVKTQVVISAKRLSQLEEKAQKDRSAVESGQYSRAQLMDVKILDRSTQPMADPGALLLGSDEGYSETEQEIVLVELDSLWTAACSGDVHRKWIDAITRIDSPEIDDSQLASENRFAKWELTVAKHYANRHEFLAASGSTNPGPAKPESSGRTFELASNTSGTPASLASFGSPVPETAQSEVREILDQQVAAASSLVEETELAWREHNEQSSGMVEISGTPVIDTRASTIPVWMAASVLILGLSSGSIASWSWHRLQSGGAYDPSMIATQLEREGVPMAGRIALAGEGASEDEWFSKAGRRATEASRSAARNLVRFSEYVLTFWVAMIAIRILLDPMWRSVFYESPLAAFGRALAGLP